MKYLIVADVHGNLEALNKVFNKEKDCDKVIVLGDIVGYGPFPEECLNLIKKTTDLVIIGNHEEIFRKPELIRKFSPMARQSFFITKNYISEENLKYIESLPYIKTMEDIIIAHGTPFHPKEFSYLKERDLSTSAPLLNFLLMEKKNVKIAFIGHSHIPFIIKRENEIIESIPFNFNEPIKLNENAMYIINPGSCGQPRNGVTHSQYAVYDSVKKEITLVTEPYDYMVTVEALKKLNVTPILWQRIERGM